MHIVAVERKTQRSSIVKSKSKWPAICLATHMYMTRHPPLLHMTPDLLPSVTKTHYHCGAVVTAHVRKPELPCGVQHAGGASAPLAAPPHAHTAARRSRTWLCLRMPVRIPSAPCMTHAVEMCSGQSAGRRSARVVGAVDAVHRLYKFISSNHQYVRLLVS